MTENVDKVLDILKNYDKIITYCERYNEIKNNSEYLKEKIIINVFISLTKDLNWIFEVNEKLKEHVLLFNNIEEYKLNRPNISKLMENCYKKLLDIIKEANILLDNHYLRLTTKLK